MIEKTQEKIEYSGMEESMSAPEKEKESSIDFGKMLSDLLKHKLLYLIVLPIAFALAAVYAMGLPDYYSCMVRLAPEMGKSGGGSSLSGLASAFGVNMGGGAAGADAIGPSLYPDLVNSIDFKTSLFSVKVTREEDKKTFTYYDYLMNEQKVPWWTKLLRGSSSRPSPRT